MLFFFFKVLSCFATFRTKTKSHDVVFDQLRGVILMYLSEGNEFPPSHHLMKHVVGYKPPDEYEHHLCDQCSTVHPHITKTEWKASLTCKHCGSKRFSSDHNGRLRVVKRYWDFGVANVLRAWFTRHDLTDCWA